MRTIDTTSPRFGAGAGRYLATPRLPCRFMWSLVLLAAAAGCSQPPTGELADRSERRPDVTLSSGVVLTGVTVARDELDQSHKQTVIHFFYHTPSTQCVDILAEVKELWASTLRPEAEAIGAVRVTMWPESASRDRTYTQDRVAGGWKANYDDECPPALR